MILDDILNNTDYKLSQFPGSYVDDLINRSYERQFVERESYTQTV